MKTKHIINLIVAGIIIFIIGIGIGTCFLAKKIAGVKGVILTAIILIFIIFFGSFCFCTYVKKEQYKVQDPDAHKKLYNLMEYFDKLCTKHNIEYWAMSGSILGAVRHKAIIPWDDDIDVGMLPDQYEKLKNLDEIKNGGYIIKTGFNSVEKFAKVSDKTNDLREFEVWIDIFIMKKDGDRYNFLVPLHNEKWPNEWLKIHELFPLKRYKFGKLKILGPKKAKPFLTRSYGKWKTPKASFGHKLNMYTVARIVYSKLGLL